MKFPKLIGDLTPGTSVGESKVRALGNVDAPFLTSIGPGFVARKKGDFTEVETLTEAAPPALGFLWIVRLTSTPQVKLVKPGKFKQKPSNVTSPDSEYWGLSSGLYVGGGRVAALTERGTGWADTETQASLFKRGGGAKRAVSGWRAGLAHTMFATGWDSARGAYRWGFVAKLAPIAAGNTSLGAFAQSLAAGPSEPHVYLGDSAGAPLAHVIPPNAGGNRAHFGAHLYVTGPGQLTGLVIVKAEATFASPNFVLVQEPPYFLHSADHGETWSTLSGAFLTPLLKTLVQASTSPPGQEYPDPASAAYMAAYSFFVYLGNGKSLFIVRRTTTASRTNFRASCYLFQAGAFTPLAWGYDSSTDEVIAPRTTRISRGSLSDTSGDGVSIMASDGVDAANFCFGPGCCVIPTRRGLIFSTMECVLRITRDYGSTWSEVVLPPIFDGRFGSTPTFVPKSPYLDAERPGLIYMLSRSSTSSAWHCYSTDGAFTSFADMGAIVDPASSERWSQIAVLLPQARPLYPQLPGEFGPP